MNPALLQILTSVLTSKTFWTVLAGIGGTLYSHNTGGLSGGETWAAVSMMLSQLFVRQAVVRTSNEAQRDATQ